MFGKCPTTVHHQPQLVGQLDRTQRRPAPRERHVKCERIIWVGMWVGGWISGWMDEWMDGRPTFTRTHHRSEQPNLQMIDMSDNQIGDDGVTALADAMRSSPTTSLGESGQLVSGLLLVSVFVSGQR